MNTSFKLLLTAGLTALVVGGGVYQWKTCPVATTEPETVVATTEVKTYQDAYIAFEYPDNIELLFSQAAGGSTDKQTLEFLVQDPNKEVYMPSLLSLSYLEATEELTESELDGLEVVEYTVDGRTATQVVTGDMSGETFTITIPTNDGTGMYKMRGVLLNDNVQAIIDLFIETAQLKR